MRVLRYFPRGWTAEDSVLVGASMAEMLTHGLYQDELNRQKILQKLGPELTADLYPDRSQRDIAPGHDQDEIEPSAKAKPEAKISEAKPAQPKAQFPKAQVPAQPNSQFKDAAGKRSRPHKGMRRRPAQRVARLVGTAAGAPAIREHTANEAGQAAVTGMCATIIASSACCGASARRGCSRRPMRSWLGYRTKVNR